MTGFPNVLPIMSSKDRERLAFLELENARLRAFIAAIPCQQNMRATMALAVFELEDKAERAMSLAQRIRVAILEMPALTVSSPAAE